MESASRKLIPESVGRDVQSSGFRQFQLVSPLLASALPDGGYRLYLELLFDDLAQELGVLFDRGLPQSVLFPSHAALRAVLDELNRADIAAIWDADETIGWIYQYFTPEDQRRQARRESPAPRNSYELAFRNQFFTPRYVVQFLVDNTLGRIWYEMRQGNTALADQCRYLVRRPGEVFLSSMSCPESDQASEDVIAVAQLLQDAGEEFPPFDRSDASIQRLVELAHCVDGYQRHPLGGEQGEPWAWETKARMARADTLDGFSIQDVLDVIFYTVRADRFAGGGTLEGDDIVIRLANDVRRRVLESRGPNRSKEESLRGPVFVPFRQNEDPRDLRILDPACGSGHFLLYCFDLLETIYQEAWADEYGPRSRATGRRLRDDYPDLGVLRRELPALIIQHNLYGVDIDLRAAQIAALALWLRAQRTYQQLELRSAERPRIVRSNVVCAEPMPGEREMLNEFLTQIRATLRPSRLADLAESVWNELRFASEAGSLLKIEKVLRAEIHEAHRAHDAWLGEHRQDEMFPELARPQQGRLTWDQETDESFWRRAEQQVLTLLRAYARTAGGSFARRLFADDAERGFAFVDLLQRPFHVVLMNPPFGEASRPSKAYVDANYPRTKNDLYAAFVERGLELLEPRGLLGAITSRTGFFLSSFQKWREEILLKEARLTVMADLGYGVLDTAMVETAAYCLERVEMPATTG